MVPLQQPPGEHQGGQWHGGQEGLQASPSAHPQIWVRALNSPKSPVCLTHLHCISTQRRLRQSRGTLKAGTWQHPLSMFTCVKLCRLVTSLWLDTLFWDPSRLPLKAFPSIHYFLFQCYSYRFFYSNSSDLKAEHWTQDCFLTLFINRANTTTDQSLWKLFFFPSFLTESRRIWTFRGLVGRHITWFKCNVSIAKIWHMGKGRDKKTTSLHCWS